LEVVSLISDLDKKERLKLIEHRVPKQNRSRKCRWENADIKWMLIGWIEKMHVWIWNYSLIPLDFSQGEWCQSTLVLLKFLMSERLSVYLSIISLARFPSYVYHPFHPTLIIHPLHLWVLHQIYFLALIRCSWIVQEGFEKSWVVF